MANNDKTNPLSAEDTRSLLAPDLPSPDVIEPPETDREEPEEPAEDGRGHSLGTEDLADIFTTTPSPDRQSLGAGPVDTSLDPTEFKRIKQLRPGDDHFERRARAQTWWDLIKGTTVQSMSVATGMIAEDTGYLFNPGFLKSISDADKEFRGNWLSEWGRDIQQWGRDVAPVYQTRRTQEGFAPGNADWYASMIPSIFSTLGIIVPGAGVGAAAGRAARALRWSRRAQGGARTVSAGLASRHMISSMESMGLYEEHYQKKRQEGFDDPTARQHAANAAAFNYSSGYLNLLGDIAMWGIAFKGMNYASRALTERGRRFAEHAPRNSKVADLLRDRSKEMPGWLKASGDVFKAGAAETIEETNIQYLKMISEKWADEIAGMSPEERPDGISYFMESLNGENIEAHLKDRHTWDAGLWGFLGGMAFGGLAPHVAGAMTSSERAEQEKHIRSVETHLHGVNSILDQHAEAVEKGDAASQELSTAAGLGMVNMNALGDQMLDANKEIYQAILDADEQQLSDMGMDPSAKEAARTALDHADRIEGAFNRYMNMELGEFTPQVALQAAHLESDSFITGNIADKYESMFDQEFSESGLYESLSDLGKERARLRNREVATVQSIASQEQVVEALEAKQNRTPMEDIRLNAQKEHLKRMKKDLQDIQSRRSDADNRSQSELDQSVHNRETNIVNLTPKTKGAVLPLARSMDARAMSEMSKIQLSHVLDEKNIKHITKYITEQREKARKRAERKAKEESDEADQAAKRDQSKQERQQSEKEAFIAENATRLEELGYTPENHDSFTAADLDRAINDDIRAEDLLRLKEFEEATQAETEAETSQQMNREQAEETPGPDQPPPQTEPDPEGQVNVSEGAQAALDKIMSEGETDTTGAEETTETTEQTDPATREQLDTEQADAETETEGQPDTAEPTGEVGTDAPQDLPDQQLSRYELQMAGEVNTDMHPSDIKPVPKTAINKGTWLRDFPENAHSARQDAHNLLIDGYPYTITEDGNMFDGKGRAVSEVLQAYLLGRLRERGDTFFADMVESPETNVPSGTNVEVILAGQRYKLVVDEHGGVFDAHSGVAIPSQKLKNMALVKAENNPSRRVRYNNMHVVVLNDDRIISISSNNMGVELLGGEDLSSEQQTIRNEILARAKGEPTPTEQTQQAERDQSAQTGSPPQSIEFVEGTYEDVSEQGRVQAGSKLYWRSTAHGEGGNDAATDFFEDPEAEVVGSGVEFVLNEADVAYRGIPDHVAEAYRKGTPLQRRSDGNYSIQTSQGEHILRSGEYPPIAGRVLNPDGSLRVSDGQTIQAFLPNPSTLQRSRELKQSPERLRAATQRVLRNRAEFYNAFVAGHPVRSEILSRGSGYPLQETAPEGGPARNNVAELIDKLDPTNVKFGLVNRKSLPLDRDGQFMMEVEGRAGHFILFIRGYEGKWYPHKLNVRKINMREASFAANLIKGYLQGKVRRNDMLTPEQSETVNGITVNEFFDLLVFHGRDATNIYTKEPNDYRRDRVMYFDDSGGERSLYLGDRRYTAANIEENVNRIVQHLFTYKNRQVSRFGFTNGSDGQQASGRIADIIGRETTFRWFGREFDTAAPRSYWDFLFSGDEAAVTTDMRIPDDPVAPGDTPLIQPPIHFDSSVETTLPSRKKQRVQVGGQAYEVRSDGSVIRLEDDKTIPLASPLGKQILNEVDWDAIEMDSDLGETSQEAAENAENEAQRLRDKYDKHKREDDPPDLHRYKDGPPTDPVDHEYSMDEEIEAVKRILPPDVPINIDSRINLIAKLSGHENPGQVWGMFARGMILLHRNAPEGTAYHEAFHAVFNLSLTEPTRRAIYEEAAERYQDRRNEKAENDRALEEFLADEFSVYMLRDGNHSVGEQTDGFFARLWAWIKNLFSRKSRIDRLFEQIKAGSFSQSPRYNSDFARQLSPRFKEESGVFTPQVRHAMARALAFQVAQQAEIRTSQDVYDLDLRVADAFIESFFDKWVGKNTKIAELWGQAMIPENRSKLLKEVEDLFYQMGVQGKNYVEYETALADEQTADQTEQRESVGERLYIPTAYEYSNWDKAGANVKLMISMLPRVRSTRKNEDGSREYIYNEFTGEPEFVNVQQVWNLLLEELSNTVSSQRGSAWEQLLTKIDDAAAREPSLAILAERLRSEQTPQHKKDEFFNVFGNMARLNFMTMIAGSEDYVGPDPLQDTVFKVALFDSDLYQFGNRRAAAWTSTFRGKFFSPREGHMELNVAALKEAVQQYNARRDQWATLFNRDKHLPEMAEVAQSVGMQMDERALGIFIDSAESPEGGVSTLLRWFDELFNGETQSFSYMIEHSGQENLFSEVTPFNTSSGRSLAQMYNNAHPEMSQASILAADSKSKYMYTDSNYYFDELQRLKDDPSYLQSVRAERMTDSLTILDQLAQGQDLELTVVANVKSRKDRDQGRDYVDATDYEKYVLRYNSMLKGIAPSVNFSDKKTGLMLRGVPVDTMAALVRTDAEAPGNAVNKAVSEVAFSEGIVDQFVGYMRSEIRRVWQVRRDQDMLSPDAMYEDYHYKEDANGNPDYEAAEGLRFVLFPELSKENLKETHPGLHNRLYGDSEYVNAYDRDMDEALREIAQSILLESVTNEFRQLRRNRFIRSDGVFSTPLIDAGWIANEYGKKLTDQQRQRFDRFTKPHSAVATAVVHGLAYNIEQQLLFHGDPAFFGGAADGNFDNVRKRTSGPIAFRRKLNIAAPGVRPYYRMAVARDVVLDRSEYIEQMANTLSPFLNPEQIRELKNAYRNINTTDAQALISLDRFVEILRGEGKWYPSDDQILERWRAGDTDVLNSRGGRRIAQLFATPIKGVHYGREVIDPDGNLRVPVYLKYSQLPLLPGMVKRSAHLRKIDEAMRRDGVDELVFESGVKTGRRAKRDVSNVDEMELIPSLLSNENWGRQVMDKTKGITHKGLDGTQIGRHILLGIMPDRRYPGYPSAEELRNRYTRVTRELTLRGLRELEDDLGFSVDSEGIGRIGNIDRLLGMMDEQAHQRNAPVNVRESYTSEGGTPRVAMDLNPNPYQAESIYMALFEKRAIRKDVYGGSMVQASSYGFTSYADMTNEQLNGVELASDVTPGGLRPPLLRVVDAEAEGVEQATVVESAQVLMPWHFGQRIKEALGTSPANLTREQISEFFDDAGLLSFIGYRIPTQGLSSIENLQIVGFLPEDMGDTLVVYEGLTNKNDSDFDIDKMFAMFPEFYTDTRVDPETGEQQHKPVLYGFYEDTTSKTQLRKIYNETYGFEGELASMIDILNTAKERLIAGDAVSDILADNPRLEFDGETRRWTVGSKSERWLSEREHFVENIPPLSEFMEENLGADPFEINTTEGLWNYRLQLMRDVMSNPLTYLDSMKPITSERLVAQAREIAEQARSTLRFNGVQEFLPSSQIAIGKQFHQSQALIGIVANHFASHSISKDSSLAINFSETAYAMAPKANRGRMGPDGKYATVKLNALTDVNGDSIAEQLSTLLSGFLDASTDGWALKLNLTDATANIAATILRIGGGWKRMLYFLNQPAIRELGMLTPLARDNIVKTRGSALYHIIGEYQNRLHSALGTTDVASVASDPKRPEIVRTTRRRLVSPGYLRQLLETEDTSSPQFLYDQIRILRQFEDLEKVSPSLANYVSSTKFDVSVPGSLAKLEINNLRLSEASTSGVLTEGGYVSNSFLSAGRHVYRAARSGAAGLWMSQTPLGQAVLRELPSYIGESFRVSRSEEIMRDISNAIVMHAIQSSDQSLGTPNPIYRSPAEFRDMFYGDDTMARRLIRAKEMAPDNVLIDFLQPDITPGRPEFISASYREKGTLFANRLINGWEQLLSHENETLRRFGEDLIPYAYTTSGRRRGMNTIQDLIPSESLAELSEYLKEFRNRNAHDSSMADQILRQILRNEYRHELLVPPVYEHQMGSMAFQEGILTGFDVSIDNLPVESFENPYTQETEYYFPEVIQFQGQTFKAVTGVEGTTIHYGLFQKQGYHDGNYHIYEYFNPDGDSIVDQNQVPYHVPHGDAFFAEKVRETDLYKEIEEGGQRFKEYTMENVLENKIC